MKSWKKTKRKHLRGSGEKEKKKKYWTEMEGKWRDKWKLYKNLKLWDYLLIKFKKLSKLKMQVC